MIYKTVTKEFSQHPKKFLFASVPADGHFNPLTGLAMHLKAQGHEVHWYTSAIYKHKLNKLGIPHHAFKKALDVNGENFEQVFPERKEIKRLIKKLCFDMINGFILRSVEYLEDIKDIHRRFPFDMMICDCLFTAIPFIKEKLKVPVIAIGVFPLAATSRDLAPAGLGLVPSHTFFGRRKQDLLRFITDKILFRKPTAVMKSLLRRHGIHMQGTNLFDLLARKATLLLQSGTPGFEYRRSDLGSNVRFVGAMLHYTSESDAKKWYDVRLAQYEKVILVTQGTAEKDVSKLLVPTLEAFKNSDYLVIATTGGSTTKELKEKYRYNNIIIEDFIPFADVMPHVNVYITNGGYGGIMLSIRHRLPMIVAGVHEGKKEIAARAGYFKIGINLNTETPAAAQIKKGVLEISRDDSYTRNIKKMAGEFDRYQPYDLCTRYISEILDAQGHISAVEQLKGVL